eukprot:TRINITY_DN3052_c0_g3_i1.p1 TRINITY_DN3052_c0_g3~~TRINITY_DN3052_c0_g3_i1.p1  ORF type:complete len:653 (+),score=59.92 TRINITY_DN3052_c0_g3_i1:68-2026(+)
MHVSTSVSTNAGSTRSGGTRRSLGKVWSNFTKLPLAQRLVDLFDAKDAQQLVEFAAQESGVDVCASRWCITRDDLRSFAAEVRAAWKAGSIPHDPAHPNPYHDDPAIGPNIYAVCTHFIKPRTMEAGGVSWALMKHPEGLPCDVFVTHSWQEGVFEFVSKLEGVWPADAHHLYCCFLSNPQNGDISAMLGQSAMMSPFAVALATAKYLLVIPNCQSSIYTRLWCVFEAHLALQLGLQILLPSKPACKHLVMALLPRMVLTAITAFAQHSYMRLPGAQSTEFITVRILMIFWLCASSFMPTMAKPWNLGGKITLRGIFTTWIPFILIGLHLGICFELLTWKHNAQGVPYTFGWYYVRIAAPALVLLALVEQSLRGLASAVVSSEGEQLEFESVQYATCSHPRDERTIREAIAGNEELLDSAIRTLKLVGRYNQDVHKALRLGVPAGRLRRGPCYSLTVLGAFMMICSLFSPLCSVGIFYTAPVHVFVMIHMLLFALLLWFVFCVCPEPRVLVFDSLLLLASALALSIGALDLYYTGDKLFVHELLDEAGTCHQVPWYLYPAILTPCWLLWLCSLPVLYRGGIRRLTSRFSSDGMLVAERYYVGQAAETSSSSEEESDADFDTLPASHNSCCGHFVSPSSSGDDSAEDSKIAAI